LKREEQNLNKTKKENKMWILILSLIINFNGNTNAGASVTAVPESFNSYDVCMESGKAWQTSILTDEKVLSQNIIANYVCVKHYANAKK
jgi:hypothetical protein